MTDKSDLGTVDLPLSGMLSPPCTCGAGEDSDHEQETVRRREERVKETEGAPGGRHSQERRYRPSQASAAHRSFHLIAKYST